MDIKEWIDRLRRLSAEQVVDMHFKLQEQIKKHYKLRAEGNNLEKATQLCEQHVALAELAFPALKEKHVAQAREYEELFGKKRPLKFYASSHNGYRQLITIMKKQKNFDRVAELEAKRDAEGWRS